MMRWMMTLLAALLTAVAADAHEAAGQHGGRTTDVGAYHVELVAKGETVDIFVTNAKQEPVPAGGFKGAAILVLGGKATRIPLAPAEGNRLSGMAPMALGERPKGAVQLTGPDGATASGKLH